MIFKFGKTKYSQQEVVTSAGVTTLLATSPEWLVLTGTMTHTVQLPNAQATSNQSGMVFHLVNESTGAITVRLNDGSTVIATIAAGASIDVLLRSHASTNGTWSVASFTGGGGGGGGSVAPGSTVTSNYVIGAGDNGRTINVDSSAGAVQLTLPSPTAGFVVTIKDLVGSSEQFPITIVRAGSELIDGIAASISISTVFSSVTLSSDGTNWARVGGYRNGIARTVAGVALFGGGNTGSTQSTIDRLDLTQRSSAQPFGNLTTARRSHAGFCSFSRAIWGCGSNSGGTDQSSIEYVDVASGTIGQTFGSATVARTAVAGCSSSTRGLFGGGLVGGVTPSNVIDYVTIATVGNAIDFGDLTLASYNRSSCSSQTRGIWAAYNGNGSGIDYVVIATLANALSFGTLTVGREAPAACANSVRGIIAGGNISNIIDYITIATTGNAIDFGDLPLDIQQMAGAATPINACFGGGLHISGARQSMVQYMHFSTLASAAEFGFLTQARSEFAGCSNAHGGL